MTKVNLIIATYNSEKRLSKTLSSLYDMAQSSHLSNEDWRIILANNKSTDKTAQIAETFVGKLPITIIDANRPGKSAAMNDALKYIDAPLIAFTDDDVEVCKNWLPLLIQAADTHPDYDMFSGKIVGVWEKELDADLRSWIPVGSTYALHETDTDGPCDPGLLWGPNMMFRKSIFDAGHRFNELIGPTPDAFYAMGEDSEIAKRLSRSGHKSYFCTSAIVNHYIKAETANEDWIIRRAERLGYGVFAVNVENYHRRMPNYVPIVVELFIMKFVTIAIFPFTPFISNGKKRFWLRWLYYFHRGLWKGYKKYAD